MVGDEAVVFMFLFNFFASESKFLPFCICFSSLISGFCLMECNLRFCLFVSLSLFFIFQIFNNKNDYFYLKKCCDPTKKYCCEPCASLRTRSTSWSDPSVNGLKCLSFILPMYHAYAPSQTHYKLLHSPIHLYMVHHLTLQFSRDPNIKSLTSFFFYKQC